MKTLNISCFTFGSSVVAALLAACGGSPPIGAAGSMPQTEGARAVVHRASSSGGALAYVDMRFETWILTYPGLLKVAKIRVSGGTLMASDSVNGNVLVGAYEYTHGATKPFAKLILPSGEEIRGEAFDQTTHNMAFVVGGTTGDNWVSVYTDLYSAPTNYYDSSQAKALFALTYDDAGNLFAEALDSGSHLFVAELPKGSSTFINYPVNATLTFPGAIRWDGQYLAIRNHGTIYRLAISGSSMNVVGTTKLVRAYGEYWLGYWIQGGYAIGPHIAPHRHDGEYLGLWNYPSGTPAQLRKKLQSSHKDRVYAVTVSVAPN